MSRLLAARAVWLLALMALAGARPQQQQQQQQGQRPCSQCSLCRDPECWRTCSVYCPPTPDKVQVGRGSNCMDRGGQQGPSASRAACRRAISECSMDNQGSGAVLGAADAIGAVSLTQCAKIAMGSCQQAAGETAPDECQDAGANGYDSCNAERFRTIFHTRAAEICRRAAQGLTDVDPTSGKWAKRDDDYGWRRLLARP
ncbi:MAG: hypothetical protein J3K34DRAFT_434580 [Monoraphidium minutum]|nr:MAG: hypothetical protein J3K34DRAFT_434580 [Monoraphidium minutum]